MTSSSPPSPSKQWVLQESLRQENRREQQREWKWKGGSWSYGATSASGMTASGLSLLTAREQGGKYVDGVAPINLCAQALLQDGAP